MEKKGWLAIAFTVVAIPLGLEVFSELAFTFTDAGSSFLTGLADFFGLEGGIHGAESHGAHGGTEVASADGHNHGSFSNTVTSSASSPHTFE